MQQSRSNQFCIYLKLKFWCGTDFSWKLELPNRFQDLLNQNSDATHRLLLHMLFSNWFEIRKSIWHTTLIETSIVKIDFFMLKSICYGPHWFCISDGSFPDYSSDPPCPTPIGMVMLNDNHGWDGFEKFFKTQIGFKAGMDFVPTHPARLTKLQI